MKRLTIVLTLAAASLLAATSQGAIAAHAARGAKLQLRHTTLGKILVNGRGLTLYVFSRDTRKHDTCVTIGGCTSIWPPMTSRSTPTLGAGVKHSMVGTIKLASGAHQLTYAGHPLYTYIGDSGPGDTSYVDQMQFGGHWFALNAAGHLVK